MGSFKKFLKENEDLLQQIYELMDDMSDEEIDEFGFYLYDEFFGGDEDDDDLDSDTFTADDVKEMIEELGPDMYPSIIDMLLPEDIDDLNPEQEIEDSEAHNPWYYQAKVQTDIPNDELGEGVAKRMKVKNMNRKKRKFMANTKADMRRTKAARKKMNRENRAARKRYYRANKNKIASYQKTRSKAIKAGKHHVKIRKVS